MADRFNLTLTRDRGYRFNVDFEDPAMPPLLMDEPAPLGEGTGPNPARVLAAAVGDCLSASLLFCLSRAHIEPTSVRTEVEGEIVRNEKGRLRIGGLKVRIVPRLDPDDRAGMARCLELFEDFCVVTESVRKGIEIDVEVVSPDALPAAAAEG